MEYIIESNIPIPSKRNGYGKYPFDEMKVGDSFLLEESNKVTMKALRSYAYSYAKKHMKEAKFAVRNTEDNQLRVWRIK